MGLLMNLKSAEAGLVGKLFSCETILAEVGIFHLGVSGALLMFIKRSKCTV